MARRRIILILLVLVVILLADAFWPVQRGKPWTCWPRRLSDE